MKNVTATPAMLVVVIILCSMQLLLGLVQSTLLPKPLIRWTHQLPGAGKISSDGLLRKDNAVVATQDGQQVFVTADDGTLLILALTNGKEHGVPITTNDGVGQWLDETGMGGVDTDAAITFKPSIIDGRHIDCRSGVSLHETEDGVQFAVYAVTDVPIVKNKPMEYNFQTAEMTFGDNGVVEGGDAEQEEELLSRVIAVNPDGSLRWEVVLSGYVEGTPLIGKADSDKIYVSQSIPDVPTKSVFDPDFYRGRIIVIRDNEAGRGEGGVEITASKESIPVPYGPLTLQTVQIRGKTRDVIFFAEERGEGHVLAGGIYVLSPTNEYDLRRGRGNGAYELRTLSRWLRSSVTRPFVSDDGSSLWAGGVGSRLANVKLGSFVTSVGEQDVLDPEWETILDTTNRNDTQPLRGAGTLSEDASSLFIAGASTDFFSLDATTGQVLWSDKSGESVFIAESKVAGKSPNNVVYAIEHAGGNVIAYNGMSGGRLWQLDCQDLFGIDSCQDSVEAEFTISSSGNLLIYGDIFGHIAALQVAMSTLAAPPIVPISHATIQPTISKEISPTITKDTSYIEPTAAPTAEPVLSVGSVSHGPKSQSSKENSATSSNNVAGVAAGVIVGVVATALSAFWFVSRRRRKESSTTKEREVRIHSTKKLDSPPPSFADVKDDTCYLKRSTENRDSDVAWVSAQGSNRSSLSNLARSYHREGSDEEAAEKPSSASSLVREEENEVIAEILQQDGNVTNSTPPPPPAALPTSDDRGPDGADFSTQITSFTRSLSRTLSETNIANSLTRTLSETNLSSLETSVLPYLSFAFGPMNDDEKRDGTGGGRAAQDESLEVRTQGVQNGNASKARYI